MVNLMELLAVKDVRIRLAIFAIGFSPIASLSLSAFGLIPLYISGPCIVLPAIISAFVLGSLFPQYARTLIRGFLLGVVAVFIYDLTCRFPFIAKGVWPDFIPKIGGYLLHRGHVHWSVGYLWRYIGNGGGMGLAFYAMYPLISDRVKSVKAGTIYGIVIFGCALATIYLSPAGRTYLFDPTFLSAYLGLMGHLVFGYTLGYGAKLFPDPMASTAIRGDSMPLVLHREVVSSWEVNGSRSGQAGEMANARQMDALAKVHHGS